MIEKALVAACILIFTGVEALAQSDGCDAVLTYASRDQTLRASDDEQSLATYNSYCQGDSVKSGLQVDGGVDTVIKAIPIKFNLGVGNSSERLTYFCKQFSQAAHTRAASFESISRVVQSSTQAWLSCKELAGRGVIFRPTIGKERVVIGISRASVAPQRVTSIKFNGEALKCSVPDSDESGQTGPVGPNTKKALDETSWVIDCERSGHQEPGKGVLYPSTEITIGTTAGYLLLPIPEEPLLAPQFASQLNARIDALASRVDQIRFERGEMHINTTTHPSIHQNVDGVRGLTRARIAFSKPFANVPSVTLGLTSVNGEKVAVQVQVIAVDKDGFVYDLITYQSGNMTNLGAYWLAVGK